MPNSPQWSLFWMPSTWHVCKLFDGCFHHSKMPKPIWNLFEKWISTWNLLHSSSMRLNIDLVYQWNDLNTGGHIKHQTAKFIQWISKCTWISMAINSAIVQSYRGQKCVHSRGYGVIGSSIFCGQIRTVAQFVATSTFLTCIHYWGLFL